MAELSQRAKISLANGQIEEALNLYTQLSELDPNDEETWSMLAAIHGESGDLTAALRYADKAISIDPGYVEAHLTRAHLLQRLDRLEDAIESALKAVEKDYEYGEAWLFLGGLAGQLGRPEATEWAEHAVRLLPGSFEALINLGNVNYQQGLFEKAEAAFRTANQITPGAFISDLGTAKAIAAQQRYTEAVALLETIVMREPDDVEALDNLGVCYVNTGRREKAVAVFDSIIAREADYVYAYKRVARLLSEQGNYKEAIEYLKRGRQNVTNPQELLGDLAKVYHDYGLYQLAIQTCEDALELDPDNFEARFYKAVTMGDFTRYEEALAELDALGQEAPEDERIIICRAGLLERLGDYDKAREQILPFLDEEEASPEAVGIFARLCHHFGECDKAIQLMERILSTEGLDDEYRREILFTLAKVLDQQRNYESAFALIKEANALIPYNYDHQGFVQYVGRLMAPDVTGLVAGIPLSDMIGHGVRPVFIVGMPRAGTSLVEQIISSHPQAYGGGERHEMESIAQKLSAWEGSDKEYPECLADVPPDMISTIADGYAQFVTTLPPGTAVMTDKMPGNFMHLVLIRLLFPDARIIHCTRNSVDTCLSCYFQRFIGYHDYAYDLVNLGAHYVEYKRLMDHYRDDIGMPILEINYEELVTDTERLSRKMIDFCGLDWNEGCLRYYESDRVVRTASYDQVRQPIYTSSVKRWRHYEKHLTPLLKALGIATE